ncbi:MAG TPA: TIGR01459 family HAD-type hydrolase [Hyphomicrobium sp.]|jgi:HAD superfamily hydrolase (TIGR01459 family)
MPPASSPDPATIPLIHSVAPLAAGTSAWLVDIWGVIHNGVKPFMDACAACSRYREGGGIVVLVSNSPRPNDSVATQLNGIGVPRSSWDAIVTSGDVARTLIRHYSGRPILHIGPERDLTTLAGLDVKRVGAGEAEAIICTGLFDDERETPDDYAATLQQCQARGLPMICANPDVMVERGGRMIYCAGAIARAYEAQGGTVDYAGKPYAPIYDLTFAILNRLKAGSADKAQLLAIGDGIGTDIAGAGAAGVRSVFVASGVHVKGGLDAKAIEALFPPGSPRPVAAMSAFAW